MTPQLPLAVTRQNAPLAIVWIALVIRYPDGTKKIPPQTDEYFREQIQRHYGNDWTGYRVIAPEDLPGMSAWRAAWRDTGTAIVIDLDAAKRIALEVLEKQRAAELAIADKEILDGLVVGRSVDAARARRKMIEGTDFAPLIARARSVSDLDAILGRTT